MSVLERNTHTHTHAHVCLGFHFPFGILLFFLFVCLFALGGGGATAVAICWLLSVKLHLNSSFLSHSLKEAALARLYVEALDISPTSNDAEKLINWQDSTYNGTLSGNFSKVIKDVLTTRAGGDGKITVGEVNTALDTLAALGRARFKKKTDVLAKQKVRMHDTDCTFFWVWNVWNIHHVQLDVLRWLCTITSHLSTYYLVRWCRLRIWQTAKKKRSSLKPFAASFTKPQQMNTCGSFGWSRGEVANAKQ